MHGSIRKWITLCEAPIGDIRTHGDFSKPGSLRADDLSLASPKRQEKIRSVLQNAPVLIDLHFVNQTHPVDIHWHLDPVHARTALGFLTPEEFQHQYGFALTPRPNAINVVMIQNEGDDRVPLTPWMIAHRLGHLFYYTHRLTIDHLFKTFFDALDYVRDEYKSARLSHYDISYVQLARTFGTTRACREGLIKNGRLSEWLYDCFAQMCVIGTIKFNPAPATIVEGPLTFNAEEADIAYVDRRFNKLRNEIISVFTGLLHEAVGQIMVF